MSNELRLSVSKTKTFSDCKKKFEFSYIIKLPRKEFSYHTFGKFAHKILEDFHMAYVDGSKEPYHIIMSKAFKTAVEEYKEKLTPDMKKEGWDIVNEYLKMVSKNKNNNLPLNVIACEKNFELPIAENIILNGMIDRIQLDGDNVLHVADYKTTKNKKYLKDDWFQLLTYAYVLHQEDPSITKVRASYVLLRHNFEHITKVFNIDDILQVKDKYIDYASKILNEKEYAPNPSWQCRYCEYLDICEEGKKYANPQLTYGETTW